MTEDQVTKAMVLAQVYAEALAREWRADLSSLTLNHALHRDATEKARQKLQQYLAQLK